MRTVVKKEKKVKIEKKEKVRYMKLKKIGLKQVLKAFFGIMLIAIILSIGLNHVGTTYEDLNADDKKMLTELDDFYKADRENKVWVGYDLEKVPVLAINGLWGKSYLVNPTNKPTGIFVQEITMPKEKSLQVYRIAAVAPEVFPMKADLGNFNTLGEVSSAFGNDVYYMKYTGKKSLEPKYSSVHFIAFLTHEAFHYYMQNNWNMKRLHGEELSPSGLKLLGKEYDVLTKVQSELKLQNPSKEKLRTYAKEYVAVMEERMKENPEYLKIEMPMERDEGTAQFVGYRASKAAGYDYGIMDYSNMQDVPFSEAMQLYNEGKIKQDFLSSRMPYQTGAQLCELCNALGIKGWQEKLNAQTVDKPVYLYNVIKEYVDKEKLK